MIWSLAQLGRFTLAQVAGMGKMFLFLLSAFAWAFRPPARIRLIIWHVRTIGVDSLSVVLLSGLFTGMVLGLQGYYTLRQFNAEGFLGSAVALSLLRELGPVLSAFMVTGRTGSAMAAEIGSMRVYQEIDALRTMNINPIVNGRRVLDGITLDVEQGSITTIMGKSGIGKSVLLKCIAGIHRQDSGKILLEGRECIGCGCRKDAPRLSYLFQQNALFDSLTAAENVALPIIETTRVSRRAARQRVDKLFEQLDLGAVEDLAGELLADDEDAGRVDG